MKTMSTTRVAAAAQIPNQVAPVRVRGTLRVGEADVTSSDVAGAVDVELAASIGGLGRRCRRAMTVRSKT
jgi:hypothetical protein